MVTNSDTVQARDNLESIGGSAVASARKNESRRRRIQTIRSWPSPSPSSSTIGYDEVLSLTRMGEHTCPFASIPPILPRMANSGSGPMRRGT